MRLILFLLGSSENRTQKIKVSCEIFFIFCSTYLESNFYVFHFTYKYLLKFILTVKVNKFRVYLTIPVVIVFSKVSDVIANVFAIFMDVVTYINRFGYEIYGTKWH